MNLRCARCGRALLSAAVLIATRSVPLAYGPKCALRLGLIDRRKKSPPRIVRRYRASREDANQPALFE